MIPKVNILLSVYKPNIDFLKKQLISLDNQDYENIEVLIYDDCIESKCDRSIFNKYLKKKSFKILESKTNNLGYVKAFEYLAINANGEYCAFCDQDDIWKTNKISRCLEVLESKKYFLVSSDREIIDTNDNIVCHSYDNQRGYPYNLEVDNKKIGNFNFFSTFADGMVLFGKTDFIKNCIPFSIHTGHDKWLIACACAEDKFYNIPETLAQYRRHLNNVSGKFKNISNKSDYKENRSLPNYNLILDFEKKYPKYECLKEIKEFCKARVDGNIVKIYKYKKYAPKIALFEIAIYFFPDWMIKIIIKYIIK